MNTKEMIHSRFFFRVHIQKEHPVSLVNFACQTRAQGNSVDS